MLAKFSGLNPKGRYLNLEKEKENFALYLTHSIKWASEIRKFHVAGVQQRLRNVQESVMHVKSCSFANLNLLLFLLLQGVPIVTLPSICQLFTILPKWSRELSRELLKRW